MIGEFSKAQDGERHLVRKAVYVFTGIYLLATMVLALIQGLLDFDLKHGDSLGALAMAGMMAGRSMVRRLGRMPEKEDFIKLRIGGVIAAFLIQIGLFYVAVKAQELLGGSSLTGLLGSMPVILAAGLLLFLIFIYYSVISSFVKLGAKMAFEALPGAKEQETA